MSASGSSGKDLSELIREASKAPAPSKEASPRRGPANRKPMLAAGLCVLAIACGVWAWSRMAPASQHEVARDLERVIYQARDAVEAFKSENNRLPNTLPNASLSSVVNYAKVRDEGYLLVTRTQGVHLVLPSNRDKPIVVRGPK